ncbi:MAG: hypothetical protein JEZ07_03415 [Phycisphaerae bacterium]|nr:hypothetical protein [Phycisphaerae bacterium]
MRNFQCKKCGSHQLSYQKYVKSTMPANIDTDDNINYSEPDIDFDDEMPVGCGYACQVCGHPVYHAGEWLATEAELKWFLSEIPELLIEQQREFDEYIEEQYLIEGEEDEK